MNTNKHFYHTSVSS